MTVGGQATLNLNGYNQSIGSLTIGSAAGPPNSPFETVTTGTGVLTLGGDITFNGTPGGLGGLITGSVNFGGATRNINIANPQTGNFYDLAVDAPIGGNGGLTLTGAAGGRLVLFGQTSTYTGPTTVSAGTLTVGSTNAPPHDHRPDRSRQRRAVADGLAIRPWRAPAAITICRSARCPGPVP